MATSFLVKVYELDQNSGSWVDQGTGVVAIKYLSSVSSVGLQVISDEAGRVGVVVLETKVCVSQDVYQRQGETIITWTDDYLDKKQLALSFQDKNAAQEIYNKLCNIQGWVTTPSEKENVKSGKSDAVDNDMKKSNGRGDGQEEGETENENENPDGGYTAAMNELPEPKVENLKLILLTFEQLIGAAPVVKELYGHLILNNDYNEIKRSINKKSDKEKKTETEKDTEKEKGDGMSYVATLIGLFPGLEEEKGGNMDNLHMLFEIFKCIVLLNEPKVFQFLLSDEYFLQVMGILEYDPDVVKNQKHREYLTTHVQYRQVIPVTDKEILEKIHQNFRIAFLKDVVLPRALDEGTLHLLTDMILMNGIEIATGLHGDAEFLGKLFSLLKGIDTPKSKRAEVIAFLQDLCTLAKKMQVPSRHAFYRSLIEKSNNFFGIFESILADTESTSAERLHVGDILKLSLEHDPELLRAYILKQNKHPSPPPTDTSVTVAPCDFALSPNSDEKEKNESSDKAIPLMAQLIKRLVYDPEAGMQAQSCEVLRIMLDPETMDVGEKEKFLKIFYDHYVQWLVYPLNLAGTENAGLKTPSFEGDSLKSNTYNLTLHRSKSQVNERLKDPKAGIKRSRERRKRLETQRVAHHHITELLSFCVQTHGYRIKYFVLRNNIVHKVLGLLHSRDKHLVLDAIRFVRTCIGLKDDFYNRFLVRDDHFKALFAIFLENGPRNNLINSAIIEMIEFIRMGNIKKLVSYIVENFGKVLEKVDYVDTYPALKAVYDKNQQDENSNAGKTPNDNNSSTNRAFAYGGDRVGRQDDDEAYFEDSKEAKDKGNQEQNGHKGPVPGSNQAEESLKAKFVPRSALVPYGEDDEEDRDTPFISSKTSNKGEVGKRDRELGSDKVTQAGKDASKGKRRKVGKVKLSFNELTATDIAAGKVSESEDQGAAKQA